MTIAIKGNAQGGVVEAGGVPAENVIRAAAAIALIAGCSTINVNAPQPHLQSINGGHPSCVLDCQTTQTATQSVGDGDVQGATVTNHKQTERNSASQ